MQPLILFALSLICQNNLEPAAVDQRTDGIIYSGNFQIFEPGFFKLIAYNGKTSEVGGNQHIFFRAVAASTENFISLYQETPDRKLDWYFHFGAGTPRRSPAPSGSDRVLQPETEVRLYNWTVTHEFSEQNTELFYNNPDQPIAESSQDSEKSFTLPIHHTIDRKDLRCYYEKKHEVFVSREWGNSKFISQTRCKA